MILSDLENRDQIERALALGANEFLVKPADLEDWKDLAGTVWGYGMAHRWK